MFIDREAPKTAHSFRSAMSVMGVIFGSSTLV